MIIDTLANAERYYAIHPRFRQAFEFLKTQPLATLPFGKVVIDGDNIYANVQEAHGKPAADAKLEYHRKYIDIQYVVSGNEQMGWMPVEGIGKPQPFNNKEDYALASDAPLSWLAVRPGSFAVFFPEDAHAPNVGEGVWRKIIVKVLL